MVVARPMNYITSAAHTSSQDDESGASSSVRPHGATLRGGALITRATLMKHEANGSLPEEGSSAAGSSQLPMGWKA